MTNKIEACDVIRVPTNETEAREARRAIARDALAWIRAGALKAEPGVYFQPHNISAAFAADREMQARDFNFGTAHVCALGALVVAKAVRFDDTKLSLFIEGGRRIAFQRNLSAFFSVDQLEKIEAAFEGFVGRGLNIDVWFAKHRACGPKRRLAAIMQNIVKHGEFRP